MNEHYGTTYARMVLQGLQSKRLYEGTVEDGPRAGRRLSDSKLAKRRQKARAAARVRRVQRGR